MSFKTRLVLAVLVLIFGLTCYIGSKGTIATPEEGEGGLSWFDSKETIRLWYSDETLSDYLSSASIKYGEENGVRILPSYIADSEYIEAVNSASLANENMPDLFLVSNESLEKVYLSGLCASITDPDKIINSSHFSDAAINAITYKGKYIGYPMYFESSALIYNETYLWEWARQQADYVFNGNNDTDAEVLINDEDDSEIENEYPAEIKAILDDESLAEEEKKDEIATYYYENGIPGTVSDILNIANTFSAPEGVDGVMEWDVSDIFYNYWVLGNFVSVGGECGDNRDLIDIYNENAVKSLREYEALNQFFSMSSESTTYDSVVDDFINGRIIFTIATTDIVRTLENAKENGTFSFDYGVALIPDINEELASRSMSVTKVVAVNGYSEHKDLANSFASFLVNEYASDLYETTGKVSANIFATEYPPISVFMQEYSHSVPLPKLIETENYWMQAESLLAKVWGGADVDTSLKQMAGQIETQFGD